MFTKQNNVATKKACYLPRYLLIKATMQKNVYTKFIIIETQKITFLFKFKQKRSLS